MFFSFFFFFNDTATTEIYTLSLHDALPIAGAAAGRSRSGRRARRSALRSWHGRQCARGDCHQRRGGAPRGEQEIGDATSSAQGRFSTLLWGNGPSCFWTKLLLDHLSPISIGSSRTGY